MSDNNDNMIAHLLGGQVRLNLNIDGPMNLTQRNTAERVLKAVHHILESAGAVMEARQWEDKSRNWLSTDKLEYERTHFGLEAHIPPGAPEKLPQ